MLAGCPDFPQHREISAESIAAEKTDSTWRLHLTVENDNTIGNDRANFHDVVVLVYSGERTEIASREIGVLPFDRNVNDGLSMTLDCPEFPYIVTLDAEETPCDENAAIVVARFDGKQDGEYVWSTDYRECNEGLPPAVPTAKSLPQRLKW